APNLRNTLLMASSVRLFYLNF
ncbi:MraY-inhibiting host cell lysis protein E, partial [Bacillus cereus group sp. N17]|nr:MraY-inhibiting host cell lysis protein E [Bacillus cereus group sp. N17]